MQAIFREDLPYFGQNLVDLKVKTRILAKFFASQFLRKDGNKVAACTQHLHFCCVDSTGRFPFAEPIDAIKNINSIPKNSNSIT
jgi:hypothetical protein